MNSINTLLLSVFDKNGRYGQDISSLHRRYQNLSLIYVNVGLTLLIILFGGFNGIYYKNPDHLWYFLICLPFSIASFVFLKTQHSTAASIALLLEMHSSYFVASYVFDCPLICLLDVVFHLCFVFSVTTSIYIHFINFVFCLTEYYYNASLLLDIYDLTLTRQQKNQVQVLFPTAICCVFVAGLIMISQKKIENDIWKIAKENYAKNENLTKELVQAMETKDNFVSMLSHEIRNPLNALKGSIDYLSHVIKSPESSQVLKNARTSGDILLNLVNNVLDAAKFKSDKMEIVCTETDMVETVKKVLTINSEKLREKEITAKAFLDDGLPDLLWTDQSRMLQILMNLVSNAVKFTSKGGKVNMYISWIESTPTREELLSPFENTPLYEIAETKLERHQTSKGSDPTLDEFSFEEGTNHHYNIQHLLRSFEQSKNDLSSLSRGYFDTTSEFWSLIHTPFLGQHENNSHFLLTTLSTPARNRGFLKIQITDTGCGIDEKDLPQLFTMFQQTSCGLRSCHGGTGLGLWICKQLCQKMNGDITVYSRPGEGSSFVLYVPIDNNPINTMIQKPIAIKKKVRVLVVDDYSVNRYQHKLLLEQEGVDVTVAEDGKEAYEVFKAHRGDFFDFILMDVQMPIMDGFTSAKLIRRWEADHNSLQKAVIYFVSGEYFNKEEVFSQFRLLGGQKDEAIKYLKKPLDHDLLKKIVLQSKT